MSENITQRNFPLGWIPSDDAVGGRTDGLIAMSNLTLDNKGIVSLANGYQKVFNINGSAHAMFIKYFGGSRHIFSASGASVYNNSTELFADGGDGSATFGSALNYVLISSGQQKKKFDGTTLFGLGLQKPEPPEVENYPNDNVIFADSGIDVTVLKGTVTAAGEQTVLDTEADGALLIYGNTDDANKIHTDGPPGFSAGTDDDIFNFPVRIGDTKLLVSINVVITLEDDVYLSANNYVKLFKNEGSPSPFNQGFATNGLFAWTTLTCKRSDFERQGTLNELDWNSVTGVRLEVVTTGVMDLCVTHFVFYGGGQSSLTGRYKYYQVNVHNTSYAEMSPVSEASASVSLVAGKTNITPQIPADTWVNEIWIYRVSDENNADVTSLDDPRRLAVPYRVKVLDSVTGFGSFKDVVSDKEALLEGETVDVNLDSIRSITDEIIGISDKMVKIRACYITAREVILSSIGDLGSFNPQHIRKLSGDTTETNLWITAGVDSFLIGTTEDIYELGGTFEELNDGTISASLRPLGLGTAGPISKQFYNNNSQIFYMSPDGWRRLSGGGSELIVGDLDKLYRNDSRHGYAPPVIYPKGTGLYGVAFYSEQLWTTQDTGGGNRIAYVWDSKLSFWSPRLIPVGLMVSAEDGKLYGSIDGAIVQLDTTNTFDGAAQPIQLTTVYNDGQTPRNRKDLYTLKIAAYTGGSSVSILVNVDSQSWVNLGTFAFASKSSVHTIDLSSYLAGNPALGTRIAVQIIGSVDRFELYSLQIEYDLRPEQLTHKRIANVNLGTLARKRFTSFGLVIDTLGGDVRFTPMVDNVGKNPSSIIHTEKLTHVHYFAEDTVGTDIGGILHSVNGTSPFEYYGLNLEETVSEKLPSPTTFLVIPSNDYGNPNRKRHSSYKFQINTRGESVTFTPTIDGVEYTPVVYTTDSKRTVEYFFTNDTIGIDIGGTISANTTTPFEFYGVIIPQLLEVLPPRLKELYVPESNLGIAAKKRLRTLPFQINTNGFDVLFTPIFDGVPGTTRTFNTPTRKTQLYYITTDVFCIDVACELLGSQPFEFYQLEKPEDVEILPVGKRFDQIGPLRVDRHGKLQAFRIRCVFGTSIIPYTLYVEDEIQFTGTFEVTPNIDSVWEVMKFPKTVQGSVFRIEIGPCDEPFHRWDMQIKFNESGMKSDEKWIKYK